MRLWKGSLVALLLTMLLAVLPASLAVAAADDPATVVQRFFDARTRGDVQGALALVADDIRLVGGPRCTPANPCLGTSAFRAEMQAIVADHIQVTIVGIPQVSGTTVHVRIEEHGDIFSAAGVKRIVSNGTAEVRDGKIAQLDQQPGRERRADGAVPRVRACPARPADRAATDGRGRGGLLHPPSRRRLENGRGSAL